LKSNLAVLFIFNKSDGFEHFYPEKWKATFQKKCLSSPEAEIIFSSSTLSLEKGKFFLRTKEFESGFMKRRKIEEIFPRFK